MIDGNNLYHNLKGMEIDPSYTDVVKITDFIFSRFGLKKGDVFYYISVPKMDDPIYFKHMRFLKEDLVAKGVKVITRKRKISLKQRGSDKYP